MVHLKWNFQAMVDRQADGTEVGRQLRKWAAVVCEHWHDLRAGRIDRATLQRRMDLVRFAVRLLLEGGAACDCAATAGTCRELLGAEASLWVFVAEDGVEPTNNAAERALRRWWCGGSGASGARARAGCGSSSGS